MRPIVNPNERKSECKKMVYNYSDKFNLAWLDLTAIDMSVVCKEDWAVCLDTWFSPIILKVPYHFIYHYKTPASILQRTRVRACMDACVFVCLFVRVGSTFPTIFSLIRPWTMSKKIVKLSLSLSLSCCIDCSNCNWNDNRMCTLCIYTCMQRSTMQHKSAKCHIT